MIGPIQTFIEIQNRNYVVYYDIVDNLSLYEVNMYGINVC